MKNFEKLWEMLHKKHGDIYQAHQHFLVWKELKKTFAPNVVWIKKAEKNAITFNRFIRFFWASLEANRIIFALELSKFFDKTTDSFSIYKIINFTRSNIKSFNEINYKEFNKEKLLENIRYKQIDETLLRNIESKLEKESDSINRLRDLRNTRLAHAQYQEEDISLTIREIDELFILASEVLNELSLRLNKQEWLHFHWEWDINNELSRIFNTL